MMNCTMICGRQILMRPSSGKADTSPSTMPSTMPPITPMTKARASEPGTKAPDDRRRHGDAIDDQRRRVIEQALALDERDQAMRRGQRAQDDGRGDGVGRRDDRAERDRDRPGHLWHSVCATKATAAVVAMTTPNARPVSAGQFRFRSRGEVS